MPELPSPEAFGDYDAWRGRAVTDRGGAPVGSVDELYLDTDTRRPEWVLIRLEGEDDTRRFVPLADAEVDGETLRVAHDRERIASARAASPGPIPQGEERALYEHYAVPVTEEHSETVLPAQGSTDDTPVEDETPVVNETPVVDETPVGDETPAPEEKPAAAAVVAAPDPEPAPIPAAPDPDEPAPSIGVEDTELAPAPAPAPPTTPPYLGPQPTATSGGPNTAAIGAGAGIVLFLLLLLIRRRRR